MGVSARKGWVLDYSNLEKHGQVKIKNKNALQAAYKLIKARPKTIINILGTQSLHYHKNTSTRKPVNAAK